ncbi:hypothetical protein ACFQU1_19645 [Chelatococcus sp. GCM10030263]|uniref:hypothetical protein n=1 Tax=Chelatococcus sp. GCM10030263 TaxID=3273387 RepID=UPI00361384CF
MSMTMVKRPAGRVLFFSFPLLFSPLLLTAAAHAQSVPGTRDKVMAALPKLEDMARRLTESNQVLGLSIAVVYRDEVGERGDRGKIEDLNDMGLGVLERTAP